MNVVSLHITSFAVLFLFSGFLFSQVEKKYSKAHGDSLINPKFTIDSKKEAEDAVANIVRHTGLVQNFEIMENKNISTANAYIKDKKRYVAYNPGFMLRVRDRTKTDWGAVSVLAHEIGHHLSGHTLIKKKRDPKEELEADKFSGFILYKMGASLEETQSCILLVNLNSSPVTHPPREERLAAITQGWMDANKLEETAASREKEFAMEKSNGNTNTDSLSKKKPFVYKCTLFGDKNYYFVDEKNQILSINYYGEPYVVGYKTKSADPSFDWEFSYQNSSYGVDYKGKIWNKTLMGDVFVVGQVYDIKR